VLAAAVGWNKYEVGLSLEDRELGELNHGVVSERGTGLALASGAVATVHKHWPVVHSIPHRSAGATAIEWEFWFDGQLGHGTRRSRQGGLTRRQKGGPSPATP